MEDHPVLDLRDRALAALDQGDIVSALELARTGADASPGPAAAHPSRGSSRVNRQAQVGRLLDRAACLIALAEIEEALGLRQDASGSLQHAMDLLQSAAPMLDLSLTNRSKAAAAIAARDEQDRMRLWCQANERMANLHAREGRLRDALTLLQNILAVAAAKFGEASMPVVCAANSLGVVHEKSGDMEAAAEAYARALKAMRRTPEADDLTKAGVLRNIASLAHTRGDTLTGIPLAEEALRLRRASLGEEHPDVAVDLSTLGALCHLDGRNERARQAYEEALTILEARLGPSDLSVGMTLANLAVLCADEGSLAQAEIIGLRALRVLEDGLGPEDVEVGITLLNLTSCLCRQGRRHEAALLAARSWSILSSRLPAGHPQLRAAARILTVLEVPLTPNS